MEQTLLLFGTTVSATAAFMLGVWLLSVVRRDASIVDVFWGVGFVLIAAVSFAVGGGYRPRRLLVATLVAVWGVRLALYLLWRNWKRGEDFRYQALRARYGDRFDAVSLYMVFGLQGAVMWVVSLPVQVAQVSATPARITSLDALGVVLWVIGIIFESVGDWQLARFKAAPQNTGRVMDRGLWRYTRHPNYFGDALVWWGLFLFALATPRGAWTVIGPLTMTVFLMRISGVPLLEKRLVETRPTYADYVERTSAFFPWFPKR